MSLPRTLSFNPLIPAGHTSLIDNLYLLTKEGIGKSVLGDYHTQRQALSRFLIGAIIMSAPVLDVTRRELRKISPDVKIDNDQIQEVLVQEILKRDVLEGEKADEARRKIARVNKQVVKKVGKDSPAKDMVEELAAKDENETEPPSDLHEPTSN